MSNYLDRIGAGLVIKHPERFDFDYIPPELVGRDEELGSLAGMFHHLAHHEGSGRAVITGPVGSGKTAIARRFCEDVQKHLADKRNIRSVHINCRNAMTQPSVVQRILHAFDPGHPQRGLSSSELMNSLRTILRRQNLHLIIVLDEVDHLLRRSGDDLLYQILRLDEDREEKGTLSLILISQEQVLDLVEGAVLSRIGRSNHMRLQPYSEEGLLAIATQRAELALANDSADKDILRLIAQAGAPFGDARMVVELLDNAARRAESSGRSSIEASDVQHSASSRPSQIDGSSLEELSLHTMLLLMAICRRLKRQSSLTSGEAMKLYHVVCEEYETKPNGQTTVWKYIKHLTSVGLIEARTDSVGDGRGRTQHISMPHMLPADVASRLSSLVKGKLLRGR